ncbi:hypothetical protein EVAR_28168_1 [Eumeta japonica]|uniref:Helitron helicase-like domain-containing protein n=1 Tax=Eumeta variegata TaxID=151549 RepID=A0A4C1VF00_EUMVA|nr:hypothetical protein EVAR_28168_1 [Eumeta japonica]
MRTLRNRQSADRREVENRRSKERMATLRQKRAVTSKFEDLELQAFHYDYKKQINERPNIVIGKINTICEYGQARKFKGETADKRPDGRHERRFNAPQMNEVAVVIVGKEYGRRDIIIQRRCNKLRRIYETYRSYDALQYPLIFWQDMYAKIEAERSEFIRHNQRKLRSDENIHLRDAMMNDGNVDNMGKLVVLPSTFTGCPHHVFENAQNASQAKMDIRNADQGGIRSPEQAETHANKEIVLALVSSGIEATLMDGGRTAHSGLKLQSNIADYEFPSPENVLTLFADMSSQSLERVAVNRLMAPRKFTHFTSADI